MLLAAGCENSVNKEHGLQPGENALEEVSKAISISNSLYFQAFVKGDSSLFIDRYSRECCIMPPDVAKMCGEAAAPGFFQSRIQRDGNKRWQIYHNKHLRSV